MHFIESSIQRFDLSQQILMLNVQVALSRFSFEKLLSNNPLCFPEILHYFRSTICQPHILIRNSIVLPLTSLEIKVYHKPCINPKALIISSKRIFQLRDACTSPQKDRWSLHTCQHPQDRQNLVVVSHTTFPQGNRRGNNVLTSYVQYFINNAATTNIILTDFQHRYE